MAGVLKSKIYTWKDTNLALVGSDLDKAVKKESAESEPAWKPVRSVTPPALLVWRIKDFKLESVPDEEIGKFFSGDSYIILKVDRLGNEVTYDVHFWIGKESTQDEYGTAAYKTVELDTLLDDKAIQHREVDGFESEEFKTYFKNFETLDGGYASGFKHVKPNEYNPRLLVFNGTSGKYVELREVPFSQRSITSEDVFILDLGEEAIQWNGKGASKDERFKASQFLQELEVERNGRCKTEVLDEGDPDAKKRFFAYMPDVEVTKRMKEEVEQKAIYRVSDETGELKTTLVCEGHLPRSSLTPDDVYFIDTGRSLFIYIGDRCSRREKLNALSHGHNYLKSTKHPLAPITVVSGNRNSIELDKVLE